MITRHTTVVSTGIAYRHERLNAARARDHGGQVMLVSELAARLAGGFYQTPPRDALQDAIRAALDEVDLHQLNAIKDLPGLVRAVNTSLTRAWHADIAFDDTCARQADLARIENAIRNHLPDSVLLPRMLAAEARARVEHAPAIIGPVTFRAVADVDPCWRPLVEDLAHQVPVAWEAGYRSVPAWVEAHPAIAVNQEMPRTPGITTVSCANPRHEALEAMRWARSLMADDGARPQDIAIAAADPADWDAHMQALAADANIDVHFVHGRPVTAFAEGQTCAALAEVLLNGLSQDRLRRLLPLLRQNGQGLEALPAEWTRDIPRNAPLLSRNAWTDALDARPEWLCGTDLRPILKPVLERLDAGTSKAAETGRALLKGQTLQIWEKALRESPANALDVTLQTLKMPDGFDPDTHVAWMRAEDLASTPRPYVRLLGLTSRSWPRRRSEDPLLPAHVVDPDVLDPRPVSERDRADFDAIRAGTEHTLVLSRARRDPEGRVLGASPLTPDDLVPTYLLRSQVPAHAASEADRLLSRPDDFAGHALAQSSEACWSNWLLADLTPHDGLVRDQHEVVLEALNRTQSATSLQKLLRDPLGYIWSYAFKWDAPSAEEEPLVLDPKTFGDLVHAILDRATRELKAGPGFLTADADARRDAVTRATEVVAAEWDATVPVPPAAIWVRNQQSARDMAIGALEMAEENLDGQRTWSEAPFGYADRDDVGADPDLPWDPRQRVHIPGTTIAIAGSIDRLDLDDAMTLARVTDYKTGGVPKDIDKLQLAGGSELQRCLYGFAVRALLSDTVSVEARLAYLRERGVLFPMDDAGARLDELRGYLSAAVAYMQAGKLLPGRDAQADYNAFAFALPANAAARYFPTKRDLVDLELADLTELWSTP